MHRTKAEILWAPRLSGCEIRKLMELICWAKSEIAVASATTTIMYLATTNPITETSPRIVEFKLAHQMAVPVRTVSTFFRIASAGRII